MADTKIGMTWITCTHVKWVNDSPDWRVSKDGIGYNHGHVVNPLVMQIGEEDNGNPRMLLLCEFCSACIENAVIREFASHVAMQLTRDDAAGVATKLNRFSTFAADFWSRFGAWSKQKGGVK